MLRARRLFASTSFRLGVAYSALFAAGAAVLLAGIYWLSSSYMLGQTEAAIETEIELLSERYNNRGMRALIALIEQRIADRGELVYVLSDPLGRSVAGNLANWPAAARPDGQGWLAFEAPLTQSAAPRPLRARYYLLAGGFRLLVGRNLSALKTLQSNLAKAIWTGLLAAIIMALCLAILAARLAGRRVERMHRACARIMAGRLGERLEQTGTGDDFDQLATSINHMLDRIEQSMREVRRVSDNVAHDLRTPLTRLRNNLESALTEGRSRSELDSALAEVDGLLATFNALLRIARIEQNAHLAEVEDQAPIDLDRLISDVAELYEPIAEEKQVALVLDRSPRADTLSGSGVDANLLFQVMANLVDNAIKFSPPHGCVSLGLEARDAVCSLSVSDTGPGIEPDELENICERFYRSEAARTTEGNGLGLSLVKAVSDRFGLNLSFAAARPGLRVTLEVPRPGLGHELSHYSAASAASREAPALFRAS